MGVNYNKPSFNRFIIFWPWLQTYTCSACLVTPKKQGTDCSFDECFTEDCDTSNGRCYFNIVNFKL